MEETKKKRHHQRLILLFLLYSIVLNISVLPVLWGANLYEAIYIASNIMENKEAIRDPNVIVDAANRLIIHPINRILLDLLILVLYFAPALYLAMITEEAIKGLQRKSTK